MQSSKIVSYLIDNYKSVDKHSGVIFQENWEPSVNNNAIYCSIEVMILKITNIRETDVEKCESRKRKSG